MDKQRITLDIDGQMITGLEESWDMWYCDMKIESGPADLINLIKQQDLRSNLISSDGILAKFQEDGSNKWSHCIIMGMVNDNISFRMIQDSTYNALQPNRRKPTRTDRNGLLAP